MGRILILQNSPQEGPGVLKSLFEGDGFSLDVMDARRSDAMRDGYDVLVILGASESANDNLAYLIEEQKLVRRYAQKKRPVLGVCLGAQLIARAFGARVYRGIKPEAGYYDDLRAKPDSVLFAGFSDPFTALHLHEETFDLPEGAIWLAGSINYENQAFQYGSAVGVQFHLEADESMARSWLGRCGAPYDGDAAEKVSHNMRLFYRNFKEEFGL